MGRAVSCPASHTGCLEWLHWDYDHRALKESELLLNQLCAILASGNLGNLLSSLSAKEILISFDFNTNSWIEEQTVFGNLPWSVYSRLSTKSQQKGS